MADTDIVTDTTSKTKGYADRGSNYSTKQKRIEEEEKELEELMNAQAGDPEEEEEEEETTEVSVEDTDNSEEDEKLSGEEKSFKKRYGDLRRHMASKEKEWEARFETLEAQPTSLRPPKSNEDIEAWANQNPDVAAIVEAIADKKATEKFASAEGRLREFDEANYQAQRTQEENKIRNAHPDFDDLRAGDDFHNWAEEQPKWVRDALYENSDDAGSVIRVLDLYKVDNGLTPSARKAKAKDAAKTVSKRTRTPVDESGAGSMIKESSVAKMTDKQFESNYEAIQEAMASGKFVYDVSGKAR
jgi:hypothetical protein|tara:strand:+ start:379 stop:1281 length:903 start_codon:yes stop_codon:yes gene_type:complete